MKTPSTTHNQHLLPGHLAGLALVLVPSATIASPTQASFLSPSLNIVKKGRGSHLKFIDFMKMKILNNIRFHYFVEFGNFYSRFRDDWVGRILGVSLEAFVGELKAVEQK